MAQRRKAARAKPRQALRKEQKAKRAPKAKKPAFWSRVTRFWGGPDAVADQSYAKQAEQEAAKPTALEAAAAKAAGEPEVERLATIVEVPFDPAIDQRKVPFHGHQLGGFITEKGRQAFERHAFHLPAETRMIERLGPYLREDQLADLRRAYVADRWALEGNYEERELELTGHDDAGRTKVRKLANYIAGGYMESCIEQRLIDLIREHGVAGAKKQFPAWVDSQLKFFDRAIFVRGPSDWVQDELDKRFDLGPARPASVAVHALGQDSRKSARSGTAAFCNKHGLEKPTEAPTPYMKGKGIVITVRF
jgi:hypothetical protein